MFYLSRSEQVALFVLLALLLAGAGLLAYSRGIQAGRAMSGEPIFVEAPRTPPPGGQSPAARAAEEQASPGPADAPDGPARPRETAEPAPGKRISLNLATVEELDALPGIGPVYAGRIVAYREHKRKTEGRGFESVDELLNVSGIGPKRLASLRQHVVP